MRVLAPPRPACRGAEVPRSWDHRLHRCRVRLSASPPCKAWLRHWHRRCPPVRLPPPPPQSHPTPPDGLLLLQPDARSLTPASSRGSRQASWHVLARRERLPSP